MNNYRRLLLGISLFLFSLVATQAQTRQLLDFNENWKFSGSTASGQTIEENITLPHTWNAKDAQEGISYYRGKGRYEKTFDSDLQWKDKRVFIRFEGVNITSATELNGVKLGEHKGGYAAFCYEITDHLDWTKPNTLVVEVSNAANMEVLPLVGDFNNYGGIYRPVKLLITDPLCISPLDFASPGVYLLQKNVSRELANMEVRTVISNESEPTQATLKVTVFDKQGTIVKEALQEAEIAGGVTELKSEINLENPVLWNGKKDPYLYSVLVEIIKNGRVTDQVSEPLGLRYFRIDASEGFFLNDEHLFLNGVSRHQDRQDMGSAITEKEHREDMALMLDMGINALRLAHYQHADIIYNIADSTGLVVWAELPWVGMPAGFMSSTNGYENTPEFRANAKQQLEELIKQNFNHPSIVMWSIFNEIQNPEGSEPTDMIKELNQQAKELDPSRLTVGASMLVPTEENRNIHEITDAIAWNRYFGWYYKLPEDMAVFLDELHLNYPEYKIGISEYGAGGSIAQHATELRPPNPMGSPHPEEWQAYYHEQHLKIFKERPFVWGTFVWNMFDFGSYFRREGDHFGINDKGLVTYDRKTKKDAFYFYKANWSNEPVLHITAKRYIFRENTATNVKVYSNLDNIVLTVNGTNYETKSPVLGIVEWENIPLSPGNNGVIVTTSKNGVEYTDDCVWVYESPYAGMRLFIKIFDVLPIANKIGIGGFILGVLLWLASRKKKDKRKRGFKRTVLRLISIIVIIISILIPVAKILISSMLG